MQVSAILETALPFHVPGPEVDGVPTGTTQGLPHLPGAALPVTAPQIAQADLSEGGFVLHLEALP